LLKSAEEYLAFLMFSTSSFRSFCELPITDLTGFLPYLELPFISPQALPSVPEVKKDQIGSGFPGLVIAQEFST
jgi:hypothetical protein